MSVGKNLEISKRYHELDPANMDEILTPDFKGQSGSTGFNWNLERHKKSWTENRGKIEDVIYEQFGDGDKVCTRFARRGLWKGKNFQYDVLHIKTFRNGKIAHIWEYTDRKQMEEQMGAP